MTVPEVRDPIETAESRIVPLMRDGLLVNVVANDQHDLEQIDRELSLLKKIDELVRDHNIGPDTLARAGLSPEEIDELMAALEDARSPAVQELQRTRTRENGIDPEEPTMSNDREDAATEIGQAQETVDPSASAEIPPDELAESIDTALDEAQGALDDLSEEFGSADDIAIEVGESAEVPNELPADHAVVDEEAEELVADEIAEEPAADDVMEEAILDDGAVGAVLDDATEGELPAAEQPGEDPDATAELEETEIIEESCEIESPVELAAEPAMAEAPQEPVAQEPAVDQEDTCEIEAVGDPSPEAAGTLETSVCPDSDEPAMQTATPARLPHMPAAVTAEGDTSTDRYMDCVNQIEASIKQLASFLGTELTGQWEQARRSLGEVIAAGQAATTANSEAQAVLEEVTRMKEECRIIRDDTDVIRRESRLHREDARKAKDRADHSANAAEQSAGQAMEELRDLRKTRE